VEQLASAKAYGAAAELRNLAIWWLRPEVLQQAAAHADQIGLKSAAERWRRTPQLPTDPGACWIAVINKYPNELGLLRPAYALPLRWSRGCDHDARLPAGLLALADEVRGELERLGEVSEQWGLLPGSDALLSGVNLSALEGQWDSAWAPLAVGLLLAAWEGQPNRTLWASGKWSRRQGVQRVQGLEAKLDLAQSFGATGFFVPQTQVDALSTWAKQQACTVAIEPLDCRTLDLREALGCYLERLKLPIGLGAHLKSKRADHFSRIQDSQTALRFYRKHVLPDVVEGLRQRLPSDLVQGGKKLITIVSKGFDLVRLAVQVIRPTECLLLHDKELTEEAGKSKGMIEQEMPNCQLTAQLFEGGSREELVTAFGRAIEQFAPQERPENLVFDLTGGKKIMSLALYDAVPPGSYVICVQSDFDQQRRRPVPYSENVHAWRAAPTALV
jgi:hypothetical protein